MKTQEREIQGTGSKTALGLEEISQKVFLPSFELATFSYFQDHATISAVLCAL